MGGNLPLIVVTVSAVSHARTVPLHPRPDQSARMRCDAAG